MSTINDGGPAFPVIDSIWDSNDNGHSFVKYTVRTTNGMTLRAWLAGKALTGLLANPNSINTSSLNWTDKRDAYADAAVQYADAVLKALEARK